MLTISYATFSLICSRHSLPLLLLHFLAILSDFGLGPQESIAFLTRLRQMVFQTTSLLKPKARLKVV